MLGFDIMEYCLNGPEEKLEEPAARALSGERVGSAYSGSCWRALIGVPCRLRMLSICSTFDNMLKLTISPQI